MSDKSVRVMRPLSAYMLFCRDSRDCIRKENPDAKFFDIARLLKQAWEDADGTIKAKYEQMSARAKEEYEQANPRSTVEDDDDDDDSDDE